jgi:cytochrome c553
MTPLHRAALLPAMLVLVTALPMLAGAQSAPPTRQQAEHSARVQEGHRIASGGGPGGAGAACFTCHGNAGQGEAAAGFPWLAGMDARYLAKQLNNYTDGSRPNEIMTPIALALSEEQREAVALYYGSLPKPPPAPTLAGLPNDASAVQRGAAIYAQGSASAGVQACINCHGPGGRGLNHVYPPIAGQPESYVVAQLQAWKAGQRDNDIANAMSTVAKRLSDEDIAALGRYLAGLAP